MAAPATQTSGDPAALAEPTLCAAFQRTVAERPDDVALRSRDGAVEITWREYSERVKDLAAGLASLGLGRGDAMAIMLTNRPEFHLVDTAAMHLGATPFSVYNTSSPEQLEYLLGDSGTRIVITERAFLDGVLQTRAARPEIEHVVLVDGDPEGTISLDDLAARGEPGFDFDAAWRAVAPADVLTLIYTSGTTGPPKGVQLTHANMVEEWRALQAASPTRPGGLIISFLPSAHVADRWSSHYGGILYGHTVVSCPDPREIMSVVAEIHPTTFGAVPRIWEKTKAGLEAAFAAEPDENKRAAVDWARDVGLRRLRAWQAGEEIPAELADEHARAEELVLAKIRARLGLDRCERFIVGAAPVPVEVLEFFGALGIVICELWGMSELSCCATLNIAETARLGTVGRALPGVELRIAADGEILVRGEIVMPGYRNQPEKTAETIDADGWLYTGDIGELDADGYLKIVDRKKELIINAAGKNMSPANIEAALKSSSPLIGQAVCIGDRRPYNTALIVLDPDGAAAFAREHGLAEASAGALAADPGVAEAVQAGVDAANARLSRVEQIKRFRILGDDWEPGGDELTPTMKLRRKPIGEKYAAEVEALYS